MAGVVIIGGTTDLTDGTAVSSGTGLNPLVFAALNTPIDAHVRGTEADEESDDTSFTMPSGYGEMEVSFDDGATWYGSADAPSAAPAIGPVNVPIKLRQTEDSLYDTGTFATQGTWAAATAPTLTGALTPTARYGEVALNGPDGTDNVGVVAYEWQHKLHVDPDWIDDDDTTESACTIDGLTVAGVYDFRYRAKDAAGAVSSYLTVESVTADYNWGAVVSDDFNRTDEQLTTPWTAFAFDTNATRHNVISNQYRGHSLASKYLDGSSVAATHAVKVSVTAAAIDANTLGLLARFALEATKSGYMLNIISDGTIRILRFVANASTNLSGAAGSWSVGQTIAFVHDPVTGQLWGSINGVIVVSATDATFTAGVCGFRVSTSGDTVYARADDFAVASDEL